MVNKRSFLNKLLDSPLLRGSIAHQLFAVVFAIYLIISVLVTSGQISQTYNQAQDDLSRELIILGKSFEGSMAKALWEFDDASLSSSINGMIENPGIIGVKITNLAGTKNLGSIGLIEDENNQQVFISDGSERTEKYQDSYFGKLISHKFDVVYRQDGVDELVAQATLFSNTQVLFKRIKVSIFVIVLSEIIEVIAMWVIFLIISRFMLGRPLTILTRATEQLSRDDLKDFKVDIHAHNHNEFKLLEEAFNLSAKKLYAAKDEMENRMQLALNAGGIATWVWWPKTDVLEFDLHMPTIFGQTSKTFGTSFQSLAKCIHESDRDHVIHAMKNAALTGQGFELEFQVIANDGSILNISEQAIVKGDGTEESPLRLVGTAVDNTEHKRIYAELEIAKEIAELSSKVKSDFLSSMSHELRTPLNAILGFTQILQLDKQSPLNEKQQDATDHIIRGGKHLLNLINDLLNLEKIESGHFTLNIEAVDDQDILDDCISGFMPLTTEKGLTIDTEKFVGSMVAVDSVRFKQVLLNLISNAVKYNRQNGKVSISSTITDNGMKRISIMDTGVGIPKDKHREVFTAFSRLGAEGSDVEGTGIGLTIAKQLVEAMNGKIDFKSTKGRGSTFWIELPVSNHRILKAKTTEEEDNCSKNHATKCTGNVLYIEDNSANATLMSVILDSIPGIKLEITDTAELGLTIAYQTLPDLILMDIQLPGMSGHEALAELKSNDNTKNIPVIAVSADAIPYEIKKGLDAGFLDYITKPFDVPALIAKISEVLLIKSQ